MPVLAGVSGAQAASYPHFDGKCTEYKSLKASAYKLPHNVGMSIFQDENYVWICLDLPPESYGALDLSVDAPGLKEPMNLHVSAQLGEWPIAKPEEMPQTAESEKWGNVTGWYSNAVAFNGMNTSGENPRPKYKFSTGRELQISKAHFGRGTWELKLELGLVRDSEGKFQSLTYPASAEGENKTLKIQVE